MQATASTVHTEEASDKKYATAVILAGIFGTVGIHHFYVGRWKMGLLDLGMLIATIAFFIAEEPVMALIFLACDVIHTILVTYYLLVGQYRDGEGKLIMYPGQQKKFNHASNQ
jgi:TM2 domain-containing membrane protein YozV